MNRFPNWIQWWATACASVLAEQFHGAIEFQSDEGSYVIDLKSGHASVSPTVSHAWIKASANDFLAVAVGDANPQSLFAQKRLSYGGKIEVLHAFPAIVEEGRKVLEIAAH